MNHLTWQIGNVKITQIIELDECEGLQEAIPNATPENLLKIPWLTPNFIDNKGKFKSQTSELKEDCEGIKDSVLPVHDAGLVDLIPSDFSITDEISLIPTPGHTPGHVSILIKSNGKQAVITADTMHHPCQVAHPQWETIDTDREQANKSRMALLEQFADTNTLFIGSHFAPPTAGYLRKDGMGFKLELDNISQKS